MKKTIIRFNLSDIDRAIREVKQFKRDFLKKVDTYRQRVADEIAENAQTLFNSSIVEDVIGGDENRAISRKAEVDVYVKDNGQIAVVVADGEDAIWCEFGAGVYHNGSVGSSPNGWAGELGYTIGSYGKGHGSQNAWGFYVDPDSKTGLTITRGTPATMPLYRSAEQVARISTKIAREVFG